MSARAQTCPQCGAVISLERLVGDLKHRSWFEGRQFLDWLLVRLTPAEILLWCMASVPLTVGAPLFVLGYSGLLHWKGEAAWPFANRSDRQRLALAIVAAVNFFLSLAFWRVVGSDALAWWQWWTPGDPRGRRL